MNTKQLILDFIQASINGVTYTDLYQLGRCRPTLRRHLRAMEFGDEIERITPANRRHRDKFRLSQDECHTQ